MSNKVSAASKQTPITGKGRFFAVKTISPFHSGGYKVCWFPHKNLEGAEAHQRQYVGQPECNAEIFRITKEQAHDIFCGRWDHNQETFELNAN